MLVSIIIPTLNEAQYISTTLQSLQSMRAAHHELVLVDGGSSDETVRIAEPLVDIIVDSVAGRSAQMNAGASVASGDVFWFLHADTLADEAALGSLIEAVSGVESEHYWGRFDVRLDATGWPFRIIEFMMNFRSRLTSVATGDQGLFVSQHLYRQLGGFAKLPLMEDIEFSKRLRRVCKPINLSTRILTSVRRWQQGGLVQTVLLMWVIRLGYVCGVSPERLANWYRQKSL